MPKHILSRNAWRTIDEKFPEIAEDTRNLWLGISADGVDVNTGNMHHSVWPILTVIYNLPPWLCMKRKFIILSALISGYTGNDIDVYLEPLVDDLHTLFETGVDTYDASTKDNFNLHAGKGKRTNNNTSENQEDTRGRGGKIQKQKRNTTEEDGSSSQVNGQNEKNVAESIVGTLLHVPGKTKDGLNARLDLAELGVKPELFAMQDEDKTTLPPAGYTLTNAEKTSFVKRYTTSSKEIILQELDKMQAELVVTLCSRRRYIPYNHPFRKQKKAFNGQQEFLQALIPMTGEQIYNEVNPWKLLVSHKSMETIGIPPDKYETYENEEGKPLSTGKSSEVSVELFQKAHLYVIQITDEIVPYIERHKQVLKTENPGKRIAFLENEHSKSFAKWLRGEVERELAIVQESNSGVSVEAIDLHISKEVATTRQAYYYGVLQEIWVLDYRFRQIPLFKCDWVNHKSGGMKRDKLGYTLVDLNNLGHKVDPFVLASQALQVFYVKDPVDKKLSIVFKTPPKNYKDTYDEVDEEFSTVIHHRNDNVLPLVDRRDLANESRDDYYRKDCGGVVIRNTSCAMSCIKVVMQILL
ncbi:putative transposon, En/Spm-like protein [Tanacetum coccineum]